MSDSLPSPPLRDLGPAALGQAFAREVDPDLAEAALLSAWAARAPSGSEALAAWRRRPPDDDHPLAGWGTRHPLTDLELLAVGLAAAVEEDPLVGRIVAWLQAPTGSPRPTLGLLRTVAERLRLGSGVQAILGGAAARLELLAIVGDGPIPDRTVVLSPALALALRDVEHLPAEVAIDGPTSPVAPSLLDAAAAHARSLAGAPGRALVLRSGHPGDGLAVASAIAAALGLRPARIGGPPSPGLGVWTELRGVLPIFERRLGPGERWTIPALPGRQGPVVVCAGPDGAVEGATGTAPSWTLPIPPAEERRALWSLHVSPDLAAALARDHRHSGARIGELGRIARQLAEVDQRTEIGVADVLAAAWSGDGGGLDALAQPLRDRVGDDALVLTPGVREELELAVLRCRLRDGLTDGLGPSAVTRYRPGVRLLFVGPSGTGKTLAVSWLAGRLAAPLYRVDVAAVVSKYIGETEQNLAELLARAESAEVVLFFDEADSLFGKRTEVKQSTDRFANAQTNYLLQRIESYDGVVVLASNTRSRFDPAFTRRLDVVIEFPAPGPEERRALWQAHLGAAHELTAREVNMLATHCDLAGGHVRNVVLAAAVSARAAQRRIGWADVRRGVASELRKLGKPVPPALGAG